jgi:hypothetical protein
VRVVAVCRASFKPSAAHCANLLHQTHAHTPAAQRLAMRTSMVLAVRDGSRCVAACGACDDLPCTAQGCMHPVMLPL